MRKNLSSFVKLALLAGGLALVQAPAYALQTDVFKVESDELTLTTNDVTLTTESTSEDPSESTSTVPTTPIPEPATWVMMIAGFGLVAWRLRRRTVGREAFAAA